MGMDLCAVRPVDDSFARASVSWTGWDMLNRMLVSLGCDVSSMSDSNDGDPIDEATCLAWAAALNAAWPYILVFVEEDGDGAALVLSTDADAVAAAEQFFASPGVAISEDDEFGPELDDVRLFLAKCGGCIQE